MVQRRRPPPHGTPGTPPLRPLVPGLLALALALAPGCYTGVDRDDASASATTTATATATATDGTTSAAGTDTGTDTGASGPDLAPTSRFPRLSHLQWENSVRDLFYLDAPTGLSALFASDPISGSFDNNSGDLKVAQVLWADYQRAAEAVAELIVSDPARLLKVAPEVDGDSTARARNLIETLGKRAYRRPLTADEVDRHLDLFQQGAAIGDGDAFAQGARVVLQALLQSPFFLYRVELAGAVEGGKIALSPWEVATRLSYMLWNTMPDDLLFAAAEEGELATVAGVEAQAVRLLADPRAQETLAAFHYQLLKVGAYAKIYKDPGKFPEFKESLRDAMAAETMTFVDAVIFGEDGDLTDLLTAPFSYVNADLAALYGLAGEFTDELIRADLDPSQRAGLLTQPGFLAANAGAFENDPIHRGVFLNLQILCTGLPPPPDVVPPLPPPIDGETLRERIDRHTGEGTCGATCHGLFINPLGFAYEHYDPLGRWQTVDNGKPIDAAASYNFQAGAQSFNGAVDLAHRLAESDEAHRCYAGHLLEYALARDSDPADQALIDRLAQGSRDRMYSVKELLLELAKSDALRFRAPVEG